MVSRLPVLAKDKNPVKLQILATQRDNSQALLACTIFQHHTYRSEKIDAVCF